MMKSIGVVRRLDPLGRFVIPKELRTRMNMNEKDPIEVFVNGDQIVLKKYEPECIFCGNAENVVNYHGRKICEHCMAQIARGIG